MHAAVAAIALTGVDLEVVFEILLITPAQVFRTGG
jgi:hypothetical protein